ncbi:oxidoreductase [Actinacidiphila glaucinigra]|uniref:oxidoreductase n=1 Tax=Actinacidiphila glaucinigra TaxID=235986 RepID=UPI0035D67785
MAASLHLRTMVLEPGQVGGKLHIVHALENVPGSWSTGPQLADALTSDLARLEDANRCMRVRARGVQVNGYDDHAKVTLDDGRVLTAQAVVVSTGVTTLTPPDVSWLSASSELSAPPLWRASPGDVAGPVYVLGGDRPLGTWLRAHPDSSTRLHVLFPPADDYKVTEVSNDPRAQLVPVSHAALSRAADGDGWTVEVIGRDGERKNYVARTVLSNLGNKPASIKGLVLGEDGYCPPEEQHPRIRIAGDLRSARFQRITTAQGSGAEAALACYYAMAFQGAAH